LPSTNDGRLSDFTYAGPGSSRRAKLAYQGRIVQILARTDFKLKYAGSILGYVWSLTRPLLTVTIADSVITGNRATPTVAAPIGPPCPSGPCGFARGDGGGIANWGKLTLLRTTVSGNEVGGPARPRATPTAAGSGAPGLRR